MNIFKFDSPVMNFLGKVADYIILNILWIICSLPILTFGASTTAKYYVGMKLTKGEEVTIFKPFFKSFKENFKQSTILWVILLAINVFLIFDWMWLNNKGYSELKGIYVILLLVLTVFVLLTTISIFPFIARYKVTNLEAVKAAALFTFLNFIPLVLIAALEIATLVACIWYANWLPAILVFGTTSSFYFMTVVCVKSYNKMEKNLNKKNASAEALENDEESENSDEESETIVSEATEEEMLILRPDEHTLKGKINAEKETIERLDNKGKLTFFKDYYLGKVILIVLAAAFVLWFVYDAFMSNKEVVYSGGLLYCTITEEGKTALTDGYIKEISTKKRIKQRVNLSDDLTMDFTESVTGEVMTDETQDQLLFPQMSAGFYDYFLIDGKFIDHYMLLDYFKDTTEMADRLNIPEEDRYYIEDSSLEDGTMNMVAFKLPEYVTEKAGIYSRTGEDIYIAFIINNKDSEMDDKFIEYLYSVDASDFVKEEKK